MRKFMMCMLSVGVLIAGVSGCTPKQSRAERQAAREAALNQEVEARFAEILELQAAGQMDDAMRLLEQGLASKRYAAWRTRFFMQKVDLLLAQDKAGEASELILAAWAKEPQRAQLTFERIYLYHQAKHDAPAVFAWCKQLLGMGRGETLAKGLRPKVLGWLLAAALEMEDMGAITDAVDQLMAGLEPKAVTPLLQKAISAMIAAEHFDQATALIAHLASLQDGAAKAYTDLIVVSNLHNLIAQKAWQRVPEAFEACVAQVQDDLLLVLLRQTSQTLNKNQQMALIEAICQNVFLTAVSKPLSVNEAARLWVGIGVVRDPHVLTERLVALLDAKVQVEQVALLFEQHFYVLAEDLDAMKTLCAVGERIVQACDNQEAAQALLINLMDGMFMTGNYDRAISILEKGIPNQTEVWHTMAILKAKAHRALDQGDPLEAIVYFRSFMKTLAEAGADEEIDPSTGITYSKDWSLGRNASRIAALYESASDPANAAKAREEAKAFFAAALRSAENNEQSLNALKAEMKASGF